MPFSNANHPLIQEKRQRREPPLPDWDTYQRMARKLQDECIRNPWFYMQAALKIRTKDKRLVPLILNPAQRILRDEVRRQ